MKQLTNKYYEILQFRDTIEKNGMVNTIGSAFYTESEAIKMLGKQCDNWRKAYKTIHIDNTDVFKAMTVWEFIKFKNGYYVPR